jgi:hypothetical protein
MYECVLTLIQEHTCVCVCVYVRVRVVGASVSPYVVVFVRTHGSCVCLGTYKQRSHTCTCTRCAYIHAHSQDPSSATKSSQLQQSTCCKLTFYLYRCTLTHAHTYAGTNTWSCLDASHTTHTLQKHNAHQPTHLTSISRRRLSTAGLITGTPPSEWCPCPVTTCTSNVLCPSAKRMSACN